MTDRETQRMIAHKHFLDAYFSLPLSTRVEIDNVMGKAIGLNQAALRQYSAEIRGTITNAVTDANINKRELTA